MALPHSWLPHAAAPCKPLSRVTERRLHAQSLQFAPQSNKPNSGCTCSHRIDSCPPQVTYGYDARNAQLIGVEKGLKEADIALSPYEGVVKVDLKEATANK